MAAKQPGRRTAVRRDIEIALATIEREAQCKIVPDSLTAGSGDWVYVALDFDLDLPTHERKAGRTRDGIRSTERVMVAFSARFPGEAPRFLLRRDFPSNIPHVNPRSSDNYLSPCLSDIPLDERYAQDGVAGLVHSMRAWFERAVRRELMNPLQPWEPIRRDSLDGRLVASSAQLIDVATKDWVGGFGILPARLQSMSEPSDKSPLQLVVDVDRAPVTMESALRWLREGFENIDRTLCLVLPVARTPTGEIQVYSEYFGENVLRLSDMYERAAAVGCDAALRLALETLKDAWPGSKIDWPIALVMAVKRPRVVAGTSTAFELLPYTLWADPDTLLESDDANVVAPMGLYDLPGPELLATLAGGAGQDRPLSVLGCGSLGSKLILHETRRGRAPRAVVDRNYFLPHNGARHVLSPRAGLAGKSWPLKADEVARLIQDFGQQTDGVTADAVTALRDRDLRARIDPGPGGILFNTTASNRVRTAISATGRGAFRARVAEAGVAAGGDLWLFTFEGPDRNPTTLDLYAEWLRLNAVEPRIRELIDGHAAGRVTIGQGCGTLTVVAPDSSVSRAAAAAAAQCTRLRERAFDPPGSIVVVDASDPITAAAVVREVVDPFQWISPASASNWQVRLAKRVVDAIDADIACWPGVETGGYLIGMVNQAAQRIVVVDCEPAPAGSVRSAGEFVLAPQTARGIPETGGFSLKRVGTWHSHLRDSGPSPTDRASARRLESVEREPRTLVVRTPRQWHALLAEPR
jgi:hypothetical protein